MVVWFSFLGGGQNRFLARYYCNTLKLYYSLRILISLDTGAKNESCE